MSSGKIYLSISTWILIYVDMGRALRHTSQVQNTTVVGSYNIKKYICMNVMGKK